MDNKARNEKILNLTCEMLGKINYEVENAFVEDIPREAEENQVLVSVTVPQPGGLIGFRGRNMSALQLVLSLAVKKELGEWVRVVLDINNYREEQKARLERMSKDLAQKVLETGKEVHMANMSSYERRICHMVLTEIEGITSDSEGEGEERHIVIKQAQK
jgi:spoIIIJ-associated protein